MTEKILYQYCREDGGVTVSTDRPEQEVPFTVLTRLIADEGKMLVKEGKQPTSCIDTENTAEWAEIPESEAAFA